MDVIGGGVLVAVAAALWVAYLLPSWFRRRQYLATERNAVRLQQTLRILAQTAETPEAVQVEATAREVARQRQRLRKRRQELDRRAEARVDAALAPDLVVHAAPAPPAESQDAAPEPGAPLAAAQDAVPAIDADARIARARAALRRGRLVCTLTLLSALAGAGIGAGVLAGGAAVAGSLLLGVGGVFALLALGGLRVLAHRRVVAPAAAVEAPVVAETAPAAEAPFDVAEYAEEHEWTPQPLPRPLTLSRGTVAAMAMASVVEAARLSEAAKSAEFERRAAEIEPQPARLPIAAERAAAPAAPATAPVAQAAPANPYARMGYVDAADGGYESLDSVLERRRNAG